MAEQSNSWRAGSWEDSMEASKRSLGEAVDCSGSFGGGEWMKESAGLGPAAAVAPQESDLYSALLKNSSQSQQQLATSMQLEQERRLIEKRGGGSGAMAAAGAVAKGGLRGPMGPPMGLLSGSAALAELNSGTGVGRAGEERRGAARRPLGRSATISAFPTAAGGTAPLSLSTALAQSSSESVTGKRTFAEASAHPSPPGMATTAEAEASMEPELPTAMSLLRQGITSHRSQPAMSAFATHVENQKRAERILHLAAPETSAEVARQKKRRKKGGEEGQEDSSAACQPLPLPDEASLLSERQVLHLRQLRLASKAIPSLSSSCMAVIVSSYRTSPPAVAALPEEGKNRLLEELFCSDVSLSVADILLFTEAPAITKLSLSTMAHLTEEELVSFFTTLGANESCRLTALSLADCQLVTDDVLAVVGRSCPSLQRLDLSRCYQVTDAGLAKLFEHIDLAKMLSISFSGCYLLTNHAVTRFCGVYPSGAKSASSDQRAPTLPYALEELDISACQYLDDRAIFTLSRVCKSIKKICLKNCTGMSNQVVLLLSQLRKLESVDLSGCVFVNDESLKVLTEYNARLEHLALAGCSVGAAGIQYLNKCAGLTRLDLSHCPAVSDSFVTQLAATCPKMRELRLANLRISSKALQCLASHCPDLELLDVEGTHADDLSLQYVASFCSKLKKIGLSFCPAVTNTALLEWLPRCLYLEEAKLWGRSLTPAALSSLREKVPRLHIEHLTTVRELLKPGK